jgi:hypothetical protein
MDISGVKICAKDLWSYKTSMHQSTDMGIHKSEEIPFVELTGHKLEEPLVHSFGVAELQLTKRFDLTGKIHSFASNTRNFMRHESFLQPKELYSQKFPAIALSQLVGGFVGSKSQLGSSSRESCQIWDIIFDKLSEFCLAPHSACCSLFAHNNSQTFYKLGNSLPQKIHGSFYQENVSALNGSHVREENTANPLQDKVIDTLPHPNAVSYEYISCSAKPTPYEISSCLQNGKKCCPPHDILKQSYADVAKCKIRCSRAPTKKSRTSSPLYADMLRNGVRHIGWTYHHDSSVKKYGKGHKLAVGCRKKSDYSKYKVVSMEQVSRTSENNRGISESNFERVSSERRIEDRKQDCLRIVSRKVNMDSSQVMYDTTASDSSNCVKRREDKSAKSHIVIKCSTSNSGEMDARGGSMAVVVCASGMVQTSTPSPENQCRSQESSPRNRSSSDCSTDSDDSFVVFESGVESDPVTVVLVSDSDLSEEETIDQFSEDDSDDEDDDDCDGGSSGGDQQAENDDTEVSKVCEVCFSGTIKFVSLFIS